MLTQIVSTLCSVLAGLCAMIVLQMSNAPEGVAMLAAVVVAMAAWLTFDEGGL